VSSGATFRKEEHEAYDRRARGATKQAFSRLFGIRLQNNPDIYAVDLWWLDYVVECEIKLSWPSWDWPSAWEHLQIPERKRKKRYSKWGEFIYFFVLNEPCTRAAMVHGPRVFESPLGVVVNRRDRGGELFILVPIRHVRFYDLRGIWYAPPKDPVYLPFMAREGK
jgi:hypothetical protein